MAQVSSTNAEAASTVACVRISKLPKKRNIQRDLNAAFKGITGILNIKPVVFGNKKTKDPICKGLAFVNFKSLEDAKRLPPRIPEVAIPEQPVLQIAFALTYDINHGIATLRQIASGKYLKKFLMVIVGLWIFSILGGCCNFLTLFYICFLMLHTLPLMYEKYEDQVDAFAEKALVEFNKYYVVFEEKVLSKIPRGVKDKKTA